MPDTHSAVVILIFFVGTWVITFATGFVSAALSFRSAWKLAAHRWRDEAKKLNRYNHDLSEQLWDNEQQITRLTAEKNVAVEMLSPIVLENESLRNKLREHGVK